MSFSGKNNHNQSYGPVGLGLTVGVSASEYGTLSDHVSSVIDQDEASYVELSHGWENLALLTGVGPVLALTRSSHVLLGHAMDDVFFLESKGMIQEVDGGLKFKKHGEGYQQLPKLFAVEERGDEGVVHSIQIASPTGCGVHKLYLSSESDMDLFHEFIEVSNRQVWMPEPERLEDNDPQDMDIQQSSYCCKVDKAVSFEMIPRRAREVFDAAQECELPLWVQVMHNGSRHAEVLTDYDVDRFGERTLLHNRQTEFLIQEKEVRRLCLSRPVAMSEAPFAMNIYGRCDCQHTVVSPAVEPGDERLDTWTRLVEKLIH